MSEATEPIIVEQVFPVDVATLWKAITEHASMIQWFFEDIPEFRAEPGFKTEFNVRSGERDYQHLWTILESVPEQKIVYDWRYRDLPGIGKVTMQLIDQGNSSKLKIINEGLGSFPQNVPEFTPESCRNGWTYLIQGNLKDFLSNSAEK